MSLKEFLLTERINRFEPLREGSGTELDDKIYRLLIQLPEFKRLPMDKQGSITMKLTRMIK